ncbi:hypothetical protein KKB41_00410, partial [Patescibacteria group bacterium]|nr:hypothetical protein [Patescibacteria group bacterium]
MMLSLLSWGLVLPASAAQMTSVSDTLSDSDLSASAIHSLAWTDGTALVALDTITVTWDAGFTGVAGLTFADLSATGMTLVDVVGSCTAADQVYPSAASETLTLTVCTAGLAAGAKTLTVDALTNPSSPGSKSITIANGTDTGVAMVAIIDDVSVTAAVGSTFTFAIASGDAGTMG